jgi:hypothetical protein
MTQPNLKPNFTTRRSAPLGAARPTLSPIH